MQQIKVFGYANRMADGYALPTDRSVFVVAIHSPMSLESGWEAPPSLQLVVVFEFQLVAAERDVVERKDEYLEQAILKFPEQFASVRVDVGRIPRALHVRHFVSALVAVNADAEALRWVIAHKMHTGTQGDVVSYAPIATDGMSLSALDVDQDAPRSKERFGQVSARESESRAEEKAPHRRVEGERSHQRLEMMRRIAEMSEKTGGSAYFSATQIWIFVQGDPQFRFDRQRCAARRVSHCFVNLLEQYIVRAVKAIGQVCGVSGAAGVRGDAVFVIVFWSTPGDGPSRLHRNGLPYGYVAF